MLRVRAGLSQKDLAGRLNVRAATISEFESALAEPRFLQAVALADILGVGLDVLAGLVPLPPPRARDA